MTERVKVRWGFKSATQLPLFMVWREYWQGDEVVAASVIFNSRDYNPFVRAQLRAREKGNDHE